MNKQDFDNHCRTLIVSVEEEKPCDRDKSMLMLLNWIVGRIVKAMPEDTDFDVTPKP